MLKANPNGLKTFDSRTVRAQFSMQAVGFSATKGQRLFPIKTTSGHRVLIDGAAFKVVT